jgi:hypothetical protein
MADNLRTRDGDIEEGEADIDGSASTLHECAEEALLGLGSTSLLLFTSCCHMRLNLR